MSNTGAYLNAEPVASGESASAVTEIDEDQLGNGATVSGVVDRPTTSYDVDLIWLNEAGNELNTESAASGVAGGTQTTFDVAARSHRCKVVVSDAGSGSGDVTASARIS